MLENYSILMSVYKNDNPEWFDIALNSMLTQTILTNDFVLIKDGPINRQLEAVIQKYELEYPNLFNIIQLPQNIGLGLTLQMGVLKCKNELIVRMDADDYCFPTRCEKQLALFEENSDLDIVGTNVYEFINKLDNIVAKVILPESNEEIVKFSHRRCPFRHCAIMYRKSKVVSSGNYKHCYLMEDYDLYTRMIMDGAISYNIQEPLVYVRVSNDFYKRRGGWQYFKSIYNFKSNLYKCGFYSLKDYCISLGAHFIVCFIPNQLRDMIYKKLLRS